MFDVVVEGKATDRNTSEMSGQDSACLVTENGTVDETDTYLRGKDVRIEFDRYGGKAKPVPGAAMVLGWKNGRISLEVSRKTQALRPVNRCGEDNQTGITNQLWWGWPHPIGLGVGGFLARKQIFNTHIQRFAIPLRSSDAQVLPKHVVHGSFGALTGTVTDLGQNVATVRLTRVPG